jgi:hypothetical protein
VELAQWHERWLQLDRPKVAEAAAALVTRMIDRERLRLETLERALGGLPTPPVAQYALLTSAVRIRRAGDTREESMKMTAKLMVSPWKGAPALLRARRGGAA